jgi:hypothetical protein
MSFRRDEIMSLLQRVASEPASEQRLDQDLGARFVLRAGMTAFYENFFLRATSG